MNKISDMYREIYRSPEPKTVWAYSPGICVLPSGRLIATMDQGGVGVKDLPGDKVQLGKFHFQGKIYISDDGGESWLEVGEFPFCHARPFAAGNSVYILGQAGDLMILRSDDEGETWSAPKRLSEGECWHQAPCNVHYAKGNVYLVMERRIYSDCTTWSVSVLAPVLMRANCGDDLTLRESWTFASEMCMRDTVELEKSNYFGVPFFPALERDAQVLCEEPVKKLFPPPGWLETNVVQFTDPRHFWYDPNGNTFHLFMRAHTGGTNIAAILKVVENADGTMTTMTENAPSGRPIVFLPFPGGHMKFHILLDEVTGLYWLVSTQSTDSMCRPECLEANRYDLPNNERQRLVLYYSRNCVDWCYAGLVDKGDDQGQARHYASMAIHGDDLIVLSRSGDAFARSAHNTNMITAHRVPNFRALVDL